MGGRSDSDCIQRKSRLVFLVLELQTKLRPRRAASARAGLAHFGRKLREGCVHAHGYLRIALLVILFFLA